MPCWNKALILSIMLLFLDIDGVMVPAKSWKNPELLNDGFPAFSSKASNALQHLISENVTLMLTTSHKANFSIEEWKSIFRNRGIHINKIERLPDYLKAHLVQPSPLIGLTEEHLVRFSELR